MLDSIRSAFQSLFGNKVRSLLTMLGVIIGVTSVTTLVAIGQGLKKDVSNLIEGLGTNVIAVTAGKIDTSSGSSGGTNPAAFIAGDILTRSDVQALRSVNHVESVAYLGLAVGTAKAGDKSATPTIGGTEPNFIKTIDVLGIKDGRNFTADERGVALITTQISKQLFGDASPIGQTVTVGKLSFTIVGTLEEKTTSSVFGSQFSSFMLVPFADATALNKDKETINRIIVKVDAAENVTSTKDAIKATMLKQHNGEEDFSVLTQQDILGLFDQFLNLATAMVSAIAAISLIVGGIGIMNIMLVTVTERTREIGLRKAVGAPRRAILTQFLTEAIVLTLVGGLIGLAISVSIGKIIALKTPLTPQFTLPVVSIAFGISLLIGAIFGIWPALRAAKKDPIEALRYE